MPPALIQALRTTFFFIVVLHQNHLRLAAGADFFQDLLA